MGFLSELKTKVAEGNQAFRFGKFGGSYGTNDPWGGLWRMMSGSTFDYRREAGIVWENSIVMTGLSWAMRNFPRARMIVERPTGNLGESGKPEYEEIQDHPLTNLLNRPNPYYSRTTLLKGIILSRMVDANAFLRIERNLLGDPVQLFFVPHYMISPRWGTEKETFPGESTEYLDHWEYRVDGVINQWKPNDVFHWRDGIDPQNQRRGLSALTSALREIASDNCASTMSASLLRNNNIPGLLVSAKVGKDGQSSFDGLTDAQEAKIREMAKQKWTGDRAGELMIIPAPVDMTRLSWSPKDMDLAPLRGINVERILALWGIPMAVAGMAAGVEQTKVGATMTALIALAWDQCLTPMQDDFAEDLTFWGQREFAGDFQDGERVRFDRSDVPALASDVDEVHDRTREDYLAGIIKRSEARRAFGMSSDSGDEIYFTPQASAGGAPMTDSELEAPKKGEGSDPDPKPSASKNTCIDE